jgi:hypothetical protein
MLTLSQLRPCVRYFSSEPMGVPEVSPEYKGFWTFILERPRASQHGLTFHRILNAVNTTSSKTSPASVPYDDSNTLPPPLPTNCCMSACKQCVWTQYFVRLEAFRKQQHVKRNIEASDTSDIMIESNMKAFAELEQQLNPK